jgi:uncharacterized membrane protein
MGEDRRQTADGRRQGADQEGCLLLSVICWLQSAICNQSSLLLDKEPNTRDNGCNISMKPAKRIQLILLLLIGLWSAGILLAPMLSAAGSPIGSALYSLYAPVCHQFDHRSFHVDGEKLGVCVRCSAIYFSFFLSSVVLAAWRKKAAASLPAHRWIFVAVIPMGIDAILSLLTGYESTTVSRAVTGALFGLIMPWYVLPLFIEALSQLRTQFIIKEGSPYVREAQ